MKWEISLSPSKISLEWNWCWWVVSKRHLSTCSLFYAGAVLLLQCIGHLQTVLGLADCLHAYDCSACRTSFCVFLISILMFALKISRLLRTIPCARGVLWRGLVRWDGTNLGQYHADILCVKCESKWLINIPALGLAGLKWTHLLGWMQWSSLDV